MRVNKLAMRAAGIGLGLAVTLAAHGRQGGGMDLPADLWVHVGDSDGDGLLDSFEAAHGLDPLKVDSFGDGIPDESRAAMDGRTMFEVQMAEQPTSPAPESGDGGGGACGATGVETVLVLGLLRMIRRRRR